MSNREISEEQRFYSRLKNHYFSLYEIQQELSAALNSKKVTISLDEYSFIESLKTRQTDKITQIKELVNEHKNQEVI